MKKILKYISLVVSVLILSILYLSIFGLKTEKFNNQIINKIHQSNKDLDIELKKIILTLDPLNFRINAKTINPKIFFKNKDIQLEYIKTQISLISILKNKIISSKLEFSTRSILLRDLITFARLVSDKPELFILENSIKNGQVIVNVELNFDKNGKIKQDYKITTILKDGKIKFLRNYNFENINFSLKVFDNTFDLKDINFTSNKINFFSKSLKIIQKKNNFLVEGDIKSEEAILNNELLKLFNIDTKNLKLLNTNFDSLNKFSFVIDNRFKIKNFDINSKIKLSQLRLKEQEFLKPFFPKLKKSLALKDQQIAIDYNNKSLEVKGSGKIQFDDEFEDINFNFTKIKDNFNFETQINLQKTLFSIDFLNFKKKKQSKAQIEISGNYNENGNLNLKKIGVIEKDNKIIISNLLLDEKNQIKEVSKIDLDYIDKEGKRNIILINKINKNDYHLKGQSLNANSLIADLLKDKDNKKIKIFKNNLRIKINLNQTFIDSENIVNDLNGLLVIANNEIVAANISAVFMDKNSIKFTIKSKQKEKITTFISSKAKPFVKRYKFIKGFEEGNLSFTSSKINGISNSSLIIDNFKVQQIPVLAKLLSLASLQGIADLLKGEGIRFSDFEMKFTNDKKLMTINELYAIGPSISILMEGYVQSNKLISLRGTLVPASTINRTIASIPVIGNLLIGKKVGEGVFGVSFKIKGTPNKLETTVNPVKTLTPRFITRTLEKIKNN
tara:strand:- start:275 stop:2464 length:2190 start_codon:yes stop_codon:yes gene_type:complete